ncbi:hypothetical protein HK100_008630 [Physocladia obscura]|uniref:Uncharacterized protein n=1 Tax=Physocladia obscura TaxID=109957 RepID=A0AAD5T4L6_9FUNG|nr:hypothetical protein HK100_008630 [Physocladia obscura]
MNEVFIASKSIQSGMVSRAAYSKGDKAASYLTLAGSLIPFPAATAVLGYIAQGVQYLSDKREEDRINNVTGNALGFSEMDEICDWIARGIVFAYEEQIRALKTDSAKTFAECCVKYVLDFLATEDSERAVHLDEKSNATVVHVSSEDGTVTNVATIPAQEIASSPQETLVSDLLVYMSRRTGVKNGAYGLSDVKLETRIPGVTFTDRGIIKQTGLRTANGTFYHAPPPAPPGKTQKQSISPAERARQTLAKAVESPRTIAAGHPGVPASPLPTPPSGTPPDSPAPSMTRSRSFSKLFKWKSENPKELVKEASETAKGVVDLKETATKMAVNVALNAQEKFGAMLSGDEPCRPDIYGYRLGTVREAVLLGMIEVSKVHSKIIPLTPEQVARDPKAQSKFWTGK